MIATEINRRCTSSYLALRYVVGADDEWIPGVGPRLPRAESGGRRRVRDAEDTLAALRDIVDADSDDESVGILLSSGIDSAIIAALLPRGARAYTIRFDARGAVDESIAARQFADRLGLRHTIVTVTWDDCLNSMDALMRRKRSPLHPVEPALFLATRAAAADGVRTLEVGNGADTTFGGLDKLLSRDWAFDEFVGRYTFLEPAAVLHEAVSMRQAFEPYRRGDGIDVSGFLKTVHGLGVVQMFENAVAAGGCDIVAPFEDLTLDAPLDLERIRSGESKYILREVFAHLFPGMELPPKIAFARPMDAWMADWTGPRRAEFRDDIAIQSFSGEQKWQLYCLERFLNLLEHGRISP